MTEPLDVWRAIDQEREALAEDLAQIDTAEWDTQSLCAERKVRDVVGHLIFAANSDWKDFAVGLAKHQGNLDRVISKGATQIGAALPPEPKQRLARTVGSRNLPPFVKSACELADIVCHGEDIRRPLGLRREVPVEVSMVAAKLLKNDRATGTPKRIKGPMQSLVLAMAGRRVVLDELSGDGLAEPRTRVGTA